jgi:hypothetical protein
MAEMTIKQFNKIAHTYFLHLQQHHSGQQGFIWHGMNAPMQLFLEARSLESISLNELWGEWHDLFWLNELRAMVVAFERHHGNEDFEQLPEQIDIAFEAQHIIHIDATKLMPTFTYGTAGYPALKAWDAMVTKLKRQVRLKYPDNYYQTEYVMDPKFPSIYEQEIRGNRD